MQEVSGKDTVDGFLLLASDRAVADVLDDVQLASLIARGARQCRHRRRQRPVDGINLAPYKFFGCEGSGFACLSDRAARLPHHPLAGKGPAVWDLGGSAPWQFAVVSTIVDYVCWQGEQVHGSAAVGGRRERYVGGIQAIIGHEQALLMRRAFAPSTA